MRKFELHLSCCVNVLADRLARYTGKTVSTEITEAESVLEQLDECRRLLRAAVEWCGDVRTNDDAVVLWVEAARKAAGGE